jgi:predicted nucleic acid-binding protein
VPYVLDACAMIAYLRDEPGAEVVEQRLTLEPPACSAHAISLCEVYCGFLKRAEEDQARRSLDELRAVGLIVRDDMDEAFWQQAGRCKVQYRIPLPDAIVVSLAERFDADVLTSDHRDVQSIAENGVCRIAFIR